MEGLAPSDPGVDVHVLWMCIASLVALVSIEFGRVQERESAKTCALALADGRQLTTHKLGKNGHEGCTYAPPAGLRKYRRG